MVAVNIQALVECTCYLIFWNFAVLSDLFWKIFKVCNSTDETISIWIVGTFMFIWTLAEGRFY